MQKAIQSSLHAINHLKKIFINRINRSNQKFLNVTKQGFSFTSHIQYMSEERNCLLRLLENPACTESDYHHAKVNGGQQVKQLNSVHTDLSSFNIKSE